MGLKSSDSAIIFNISLILYHLSDHIHLQPF
nr:MAG TPA: hypothetical protein [Caudoviricetes sp.]